VREARCRVEQKNLTGNAAIVLIDGTIIADTPRSPSLDILHTWLTRWERAGRPANDTLTFALIRNDTNDCPGWDLRASHRPAPQERDQRRGDSARTQRPAPADPR
jgi:hypothetical protein